MLRVFILSLSLTVGILAEDERSSVCAEKNGYYPIQDSCDSYVECKKFVAHKMTCPDGMHYNPAANYPDYPCGYPPAVTCQGRGAPQPAQPTEECPHQYGFFPRNFTSSDCGMYIMCVAGYAIEMACPPGLAFNAETAQCDWADLVPSCDAEQYLSFKCPELPEPEDGDLPTVNYRFEGSCSSFYSCLGSRVRLLTCDRGYAFDEALGRCVYEELVKC